MVFLKNELEAKLLQPKVDGGARFAKQLCVLELPLRAEVSALKHQCVSLGPCMERRVTQLLHVARRNTRNGKRADGSSRKTQMVLNLSAVFSKVHHV